MPIAIGEELEGPGCRMVLITDDGAILTAAEDAGLSSHARRFEDHVKSLWNLVRAQHSKTR